MKEGNETPARMTENLARTICGAAKSTYPDEFIALLRAREDRVISELIVLPLSVYGDGFSSINFGMLPITSDAAGSIHSHPGYENRPSRGDLLFFSRVKGVHLIVGYPYRKEDIAAYDNLGKRIALEIIINSKKAQRKKTERKG